MSPLLVVSIAVETLASYDRAIAQGFLTSWIRPC